MEKNMENEMETGGIFAFKELSLSRCIGGNPIIHYILIMVTGLKLDLKETKFNAYPLPTNFSPIWHSFPRTAVYVGPFLGLPCLLGKG